MEEKGSASDFKMLLLVGIIVAVITFEITIIRIYGFVNPAPLLSVILPLFVIGILICCFGHVYMSFRLRYLAKKFGKVRFGSKKIISCVPFLQIIPIGLMILLLYQVLILLSYSLILTSTIFLISYMFGIISLVFTS